jgi:hypothetical protein
MNLPWDFAKISKQVETQEKINVTISKIDPELQK